MGTRPVPAYVLERIHFDLWAAGGKAKNGMTCVIAFIDAFSKYLITVPSRNHQAPAIVNAFLVHVAAKHGLPAQIISDGAPELRGQLQEQMFKATG